MGEKYRPTAFFNGVSTFKAAFPDLGDAQIEWREKRGPEDTASGELRKAGFKRGNLNQGVLPCTNPSCHEGGYEVDRLIATMLQLDETTREGTLLCSGREIGEEARRGPVRCTHRMEYRMTLSPRDEKEERGDRRPNPRRGRNRSRRSPAA